MNFDAAIMLIDKAISIRPMRDVPCFAWFKSRMFSFWLSGRESKVVKESVSHAKVFDPNLNWMLVGEGCSSILLGEKSLNTVLRFRKIKPFKLNENRNGVIVKVNEDDIAGLVSFSDGVLFQSCPTVRRWLSHVKLAELEQSFQDFTENYFQTTMSPRTMKPIECDTVKFDRALEMPLLTILQKPCILASSHTYTVELKPKEGTLPSGMHVHASRRNNSKFFLKQRQKLLNGEIPVASCYSPLDLFSRDRSRMVRAITALIENPQNNLKIFRDGSLVFGQTPNGANNDFHQCISKMFAHEGDGNAGSAGLLASFANLIVDMLNNNIDDVHCSVLDALLGLQKTLAPADIVDVYPAYEKLKACLAGDMQISDALQVYSSDYARSPFWILSGLDSIGGLSTEMQDAVKLIRNFLVAATLKDSSILLTFQRIDAADVAADMIPSPGSAALITSSTSGCTFQFETHLVDLDPKPFDRVANYYKEAKKLEMLTIG